MTLSVENFDSDPWLLNCQNGALDLRNGELRPHDRNDHLTTCLPVAYNPAAKCPRWTRFMDEIFGGDESLVEFMHRALGYALTGDISEQAMFILYGFGANGKSTMLNTVATLLGDLAKHSNVETFTEHKASRIPEDRARLRGARFVTTSETGRGHQLDESFVKDATGGEPITARFLHQNTFEFRPAFKLFMACNHKPGISGTDHGIWRRIRLVPFDQKFDPRQEPDLEFTLKNELAGILAWAVEGCRKWQDKGLGMPDAVKVATESYRSESDLLGTFLNECCKTDPILTTSASDLYNAYREWCDNGGYRPMNQRNFGLGLKERGFENYTSSGRKKWRGIGVQT
jgi:putative DNA primase/helicase